MKFIRLNDIIGFALGTVVPRNGLKIGAKIAKRPRAPRIKQKANALSPWHSWPLGDLGAYLLGSCGSSVGSLLLALAILCLAFPHRAAAQATQPADDPNSDDAEVERRMLQLPPGFDIQLYASEPVLKRPVSMTFDAQGRLWVLCIPRYPQ